MAVFVHIANQRDAGRIRKNGLKPKLAIVRDASGISKEVHVVYCVPVVADYFATFQWLRELKRRGHRTSVGVQFRINDRELVWFGKFGKSHDQISAASAIGRYLKSPDPLGLEVLVPRRVAACEIMRIRALSQVTGWRFFPNSKNTGTTWWPLYKGSIKRRRVIESLNRKDARERRGNA